MSVLPHSNIETGSPCATKLLCVARDGSGGITMKSTMATKLAVVMLALAGLLSGQTQAEGSVPVKIDGVEIFRIYAPMGPDTAEHRAEAVERRIHGLGQKGIREKPVVRRFAELNVDTVAVGQLVLLSVSDADAEAARVPRDELAAQYAAAIEKTLATYGERHSWWAMLVSLAKSSVVWALFVIGVWLIKRGFDWLNTHIHDRFTLMTQRKGVRGLNFVLWERLFLFLVFLLKIVTGVFLLFQVSLLVSYTFSLFPATAGVSSTLLDYFKNTFSAMAMAVVNYLPSGGFVLILGAVTYYGVRLLSIFFRAIERGDIVVAAIHPEAARPTFQLLRILVVLFMLVIAFPYLPGGQSDAFKGVSIFIGVLVSIGSGSAMGNVTAGVIITYMRPFRIGDVIKVGEETGEVTSKSLLVTRIRNLRNVEVVIPNSTILAGQVLNFSEMARKEGVILHTTATIGYETPWRKVHELLLRAAEGTPYIQQSPSPFVLQTALNDYNISYDLNVYTRDPVRMLEIFSALHANIQEQFSAAGIEIMSPSYYAIRNGSSAAIPSPEGTARREAPPFRIKSV